MNSVNRASRGTYDASWQIPSPTDQMRGTSREPKVAVTRNVKSPPKDGVKTRVDWKPYVIGRAFLASFTLLSVFFIIIIEALFQISQKNAGLVFGSINNGDGEPEALTTGDKFGFQYFPTLVSVIYGLLWTWVDHDIKRLEPYYQLSAARGVLARDSLLLNYPYSLVAGVPIVAFKRKHWAVFYSGTILVLIFFAITPLFSAVFATSVVHRSTTALFQTSKIIPLETQNSSLSAAFSFLAYDYKYFNASLPPFSTKDFAVLPFQLADGSSRLMPNETWTGESTRFSADLKCKEAAVKKTTWVIHNRTEPYSFLFTSPTGDCSYNLTYKEYPNDQVFLFESDYNTWFTSHGKNLRFVPPNDMADDYALSSSFADCPNKHMFMAGWGKELLWNLTDREVASTSAQKWYTDNWTILFCEPIYESQPVLVTVQATTGAILSVAEKGDKTIFSGLNATYFEDLMSIGINAASTTQMDVATEENTEDEYPFAPPNHRFQLRRRFQENITIYNTHGLTGFGLADETDLESLLDPGKLGEMFARAYRLLFAMAVASELSSPDTTTADGVSFTRTYQVEAVIVDPIFARLVEASMGVLVLFAIGLIVVTWSRKCNLAHDPSSIAAGMTAIAGSPGVIRDMENSEWMGEDKLVSSLRKSDHRYSLVSLPTGGHRLVKMNPTVYKTKEEEDQAKLLLEDSAKSIESMALDSNKGHWELHPAMGSVVCTIFLGLLIFIAYLYSEDKKRDGLPRYGNNFQNNLLYNYLPTFIATFIEPFWVLITRYTALVMPYQELRKGNSSPLKSLVVNYDSKPPHFVTYRSFKSRHFLLSALSIMSLSANILAVAFGGLFQDKTTTWQQPANFIQPWSPVMKPSNVTLDTIEYGSESQVSLSTPNFIDGDVRQMELFYVNYANTSQNLSLPQWTSSEYFFLPFDSADPKLHGKPRTGETRGYGANITCYEHSPGLSMMIHRQKDDGSGDYDVGRDYTLALYRQCLPNNSSSAGTFGVDMYTGDLADYDISVGKRVLPLVAGMGYTNFLGTFRGESNLQCPGLFVAGWIQSKVLPVSSPLPDDPERTVMGVEEEPEFVAIDCEVNLQTALFSVRVDQNNSVMEYNRTGGFEDPNNFMMDSSANQVMNMFNQMMSDDANNKGVGYSGGSVSRYVRNDPKPYDWVNYFMRNLPGDDKPNNTFPPDIDVSGRALSRVYKSIFAIFMQRYSVSLFPPVNGTLVAGKVQLSEGRMEVAYPMFIISVAILSLFTIVGIITYIIRPGHFLSNLPTSMAVEMSTYYASNAVEDVYGTEAMGIDERGRLLKRLGNKYGYGVYVGRDGKQHFGIDREPLVGRGSKAKMQARAVRSSEGFSTGADTSRDSGVRTSVQDVTEVIGEQEENEAQQRGLLRIWDREQARQSSGL